MTPQHAEAVMNAQRIRQLEAACLDLLAKVEAQDRRIRDLEMRMAQK